MKRIIKNTLSLSSANMLTTLINILCMPIIIKNIGVEQYGIYAYLFIQSQMLLMIVNNSFDVYLVNKFSSKDGCEKYIINVVLSRLCIYVIASFFIVIYLRWLKFDMDILILMIISILPFCFSITWYYQLKEKMSVIAIANIVGKLTFLISLFFGFDSIYYIFSFLIISNFITVGLYWYIFEKIKLNLKFDFKELVDLNMNMLPIFSGQFIVGLIPSVASSLALNFGGGIMVFSLDVFNKLTSLINLFFNSFVQSIYPQITKVKNKVEFNKVFFSSSFLIVFSSLLGLGVTIVLYDKLNYFFALVLGEDINRVGPIVFLSLCYAMVVSLNSLFLRFVIYFNKIKIINISSSLCLFVVLIYGIKMISIDDFNLFIGMILGQSFILVLFLIVIYGSYKKL